MLCDSLVLSHLNYGDVIYDSCLIASDAFRIQKLQNSCLNLTHKLNDAHWLNMKNRRLLHACCINTIKVEFMNRYNFPGVIGVIDCTHTALLKPSEEEHNFINRKGFYSITCQVICDHNLKSTGLNTNFGGSNNDSFMWRNSAAHNFMANLYHNNELCCLLGDSGYPLQPYLLTPFHNPPDQKTENYNQALCIARSTTELCFSLLKGRFT
nr:unnamed protein product [Callosobruchus analis]